jgi:hypothetical protein
MAAGQGYIEFATGDVLTAASANGYLASQVVMVFASAAARTSAIASPQEGMISYLKDTDVVQTYSGSAWVTVGGSASPLTTKGDLYGYSTTGARVPVGTNGQILTADSTAATGVAWATASSGAGLTKVSTSSFSGVSTHSVNSVFSSTYRNYRIILDITSVSGAPDIRMKMRASGTDSSTGLYESRMLMYATTMYQDEISNQAYWWVGIQDSSKQEAGASAIDIFTPNVAIKTKMNGIVWGVGGAQFLAPVGGYVNNTTQYDGFTIYTTGGTMDGSVTIYGYSN